MAKRVDANQAQIVKELRDAGCSVQCLHEVGKGCPDILVGYEGYNFLFEIKDPSKPPSKRKLTSDEETWHNSWAGDATIIFTSEYALHYMESCVGCSSSSQSTGL